MYPIKTSKPYDPNHLEQSANVYTTVYLGNYVAGDYDEGGGSHPGVDIMPMTPNDTCFAVLNGTVFEAKQNASEGNYVVLKHENVSGNGTTGTYYSCYLHLSEFSVTKGQSVQEGDVIGKTGNTGNSTAEHLHFQMDTSDAPFHPYWPFNFKDAKDLGLGFMEAVNRWLGIENARKYTVNPLVFLSGASIAGASVGSSTVTPVQPVKVQPVVQPAKADPAPTPTVIASVHTTQIAGTNVSMIFNDVASTDTYAEAIRYVRDKGIASGQAGNFLPDDTVTRWEILKMAFVASGQALSMDPNSYFSDVPTSSSFLPYINTARELHTVSGYPDGTFQPNNPVTRAEGLKIVLGIIGVTLGSVDGPVYADVGKTDWYAPYVFWSRENEVLEAQGADFLPNSPLRRAEVAQIIYMAKN